MSNTHLMAFGKEFKLEMDLPYSTNMGVCWVGRFDFGKIFCEAGRHVFIDKLQFVPETYEPILVKRKAARFVSEEQISAPLLMISEEFVKKRVNKSLHRLSWMTNVSFIQLLSAVTSRSVSRILGLYVTMLTVSPELLAYERMALLLDLW